MSAETPSGRTIKDVVKGMYDIRYNNRKVTDLHALRGTMDVPVYDQTAQAFDPGQTEGGVWENVAEHSATATLVTDVLAEALHLKPNERRELNLAAWLHDSNKKTERRWHVEINAADIDDAEGMFADDGETIFSHAVQLREQQLRAGEITTNTQLFEAADKKTKAEARIAALDSVAEMEEWENAEAGIPPRVSKLMKANIPPSENGHATLTEKIMWFADACLTGTDIKPINQRFNDLEQDQRNGPLNIEFSDSYRPKYNGRSLYDVQRQLGTEYAAEFAQSIGIQPEEIYSWLSEQVANRITAGQMPSFKG